jgi:hypothetical protein
MSIREDITKDIIIVLQEIEDPRPVLVTREPFEPEKLAITQFPAILVNATNEERETVSMGEAKIGLRQGSIEYELRGFVRGNELDAKRNDLIESIEEALDQDRQRNLPDKVLDSQVIKIEIIKRLPPLAEFIITYQTKYRYIRTVS